MRWLLKDIKIDMTDSKKFEHDLDNAIDALNDLEKKFQKAMDKTVESLAEDGADMARDNLVMASAVLGGEPIGPLLNNFDWEYDKETGIGKVTAIGDEMVYLEFGTGIVGMYGPHQGMKEGESHPPVMHYKGRTYTKYDTYEHGDAGWYYWSDEEQKWVLTQGNTAWMFMYDTLKQLAEKAPMTMKMNLWSVMKE